MKESITVALNRYFGCEVELKELFIGGNSVVYHIAAGNLEVAVKEFSGSPNRRVNSLQREIAALDFLSKFCSSSIPELFFANVELGIIAMEYIDGDKPQPNKHSMQGILDFVFELHKIYEIDSSFGYAVDAGLSYKDLLKQISRRLNSLEGSDLQLPLPKISKLLDSLLKRVQEEEFFCELTYSVSDLGLHNILLRQEQFCFIDLEYFGKDNSLKLVGDFLIHPQNTFSREENYCFLERSRQYFGFSDSQLKAILSLLALIWSLICAKRLEMMTKEETDSLALEMQRERVGYYLEMVELILKLTDIEPVFDIIHERL